jgi:mRNA interferase MazF
MSATKCRRGEIWLADFNPGRGSEQRGIRPALIIQNDIGNQYAATTIVAAITTTIKEYPITVILDAHEAGLEQRSMINLAQVLTLDQTRLTKKLGAVSEARIKDVDAALRLSLGLND